MPGQLCMENCRMSCNPYVLYGFNNNQVDERTPHVCQLLQAQHEGGEKEKLMVCYRKAASKQVRFTVCYRGNIPRVVSVSHTLIYLQRPATIRDLPPQIYKIVFFVYSRPARNVLIHSAPSCPACVLSLTTTDLSVNSPSLHARDKQLFCSETINLEFTNGQAQSQCPPSRKHGRSNQP